MKFRELFSKWGLTNVRLHAGFGELEFSPSDPDREAAWELYVELLTRITTQRLSPDDGDEKTALTSIHELFELTRETLKSKGRGCQEFAKVAIVVLNQVVRPFTAKWHKLSLDGQLEDQNNRAEFRNDLADLQKQLRGYSKLLASMANVEDLTTLTQPDGQNDRTQRP